MKSKKYPKTLYVKWEGTGKDAYLNPSQSIDYHAETEPVTVAIYELKKTVTVSRSVQVTE